MTDIQDTLDECAERASCAFPKTDGSAVARDAALYLAHTGNGRSIRALAKATGAHPSTVMRAVRRVEQKRDDPLFDQVLTSAEEQPAEKAPVPANGNTAPGGAGMDLDALKAEAKKYLRRLCEPGAFLLIAQGTDKAGVFCAANEHKRPIAIFPVKVAAEFLKQDWIKAAAQGSSSVRYRITEVGRSFLRRTLSEDEAGRRGAGMANTPDPYQSQHQEIGNRVFADPASGDPQQVAINLGESPIGWLTRRKGPDGKPFLAIEEVEAGEKLRADFEAAQMGPQVAQNWQKFLTPGDKYSGTPMPGAAGQGSSAARDRVMTALAALGPGLSDVAMRTCCFLEGLEACERRMGWSARSGKVVLKLALQRLAEHYGMAVFRN